jgi:phosphonate transport system ATP-binding protein
MNDSLPDAQAVPHGADTTEVAVRLREVVKEFDGGRVKALRGISLEVPRGQRLVLLGLSGSGKSTTLRLLNGLAAPTAGDVEVLGQLPAEMRERDLRRFRRRIGFIFQHFNLVGRLSAIENVMIGGLGGLRGPRYGVMMYPDAYRRRALQSLERVGLAPQAFQRANTLSGGQQQRVGIARALFQRPEIVLADEPVASLDPESSRQVMDLLFQVCDEDGLTVICSLHQVELARDWADRMVGLRDGMVVADADPHSLSADELREVYRGREGEAS